MVFVPFLGKRTTLNETIIEQYGEKRKKSESSELVFS